MKKIIIVILAFSLVCCGSKKQKKCDAYGSNKFVKSEKIKKNEIG